MDAFASNIEKSRLFSLETEDVDELAETYNSVLATIFDKYAPVKVKTITVHPAAPWYNDTILETKRDRR